MLGICAGMCISLGGGLFIIAKNSNLPILGGFLFPVGLLMICLFGFNLYTGKVGYVFINDKKYAWDLLIMIIGNFVGCLLAGYALRLIFINNEAILSTAQSVATGKLVDLGNGGKPWYTMLLSAVLCNILVFVAVDTFKKQNLHILLRVFVLFCAIAAFVILGFDHCVANMFYYAFANLYFSNEIGRSLLSLLIVIVGNSLGAILTFYVFKLAEKK